jgi:anti-sigma regulatory factor (Ser/Thr protein kinase)
MDVSCATALPGQLVRLSVPATSPHLGVVAATTEAMAELAGLGSHATSRARLIAEEIFMHVSDQCGMEGSQGELGIKYCLAPDGLQISFKSKYLAYDPQAGARYSLESLFQEGAAAGLGLHLVKTYAQKISLKKKGLERELIILMARREGELGSRAWSRLVPHLADGLKLSPFEHKGKWMHRLDMPGGAKPLVVRAMAHQVLSLVDGETHFGQIMAHTLKVMPERDQHEVEDLFEVLIERGIVRVSKLPLPAAEVEITEEDRSAAKAIKAYERFKRPRPAATAPANNLVKYGPEENGQGG